MNVLGKVMLPLFVLLTAFSTRPARGEDGLPATEERKAVYVIPIEGMIEKGLVYVIRRGVLEAEAAKADAIIFKMDTPGGAVNATEEIITILQALSVPSYTFVERNAISAGAIIAVSTDHIYMTPGSKIGDAMPIMASPTGGVQPLPDAEREKITSYVDTIIRASAEQRGHSKELASCMVRRELEFKVGDKVICAEGELLTMTNVEAEQPDEEGNPLLSSGTVESLEEMLDTIGLAGADITTLEVSTAEEIARFIAALAPLFLAAGLLGLYLEIKTPGFGVPGLLGLTSLAIYFWGHHVAGLAGMEDVALLIVGLALVFIEVFITPGFGVLGLAGLSLMLWALLSAMIERLPGEPWYPSWPRVEIPLLKLSAAFAFFAVGAVVLAKILPRSAAFRPLVLGRSTSRAEGYTATKLDDKLIGVEGTAVTDLHPAGSAMFGERKLDVITHGEYLGKGEKVRIVETRGNRIIVEASQVTTA